MIKSNAIFSEDRIHRYVLIREWDLDKPSLMFVGLNPSTADEEKNDPTVRRCIGFAKRWGFGKLLMTNIFAFRSTLPKNLFKSENPIGNKNNYWLKKLSKKADKIVLAYGNHGKFNNRHEEILKIVDNPHCIKKTKNDMPIHPLYVKYTNNPIKY